MARTSLQGKKKSELVYRWLVLMALFIIFIIFARAVWSLWQKDKLAHGDLSASTSELETLMERKATLEDKIARLKTERGLEEEIRANFAVVKPGEKVINIVDNTSSTATATTVSSTKPWWQIW